LREEVESFDCENCTAPERLDNLDPANREAWQLFNQLACRICMDIPGLASPVMARVVSDKDAEDATDLLQRLAVIYDAVRPPPEP
jgi:hypothetical protein